MQLRTRTILAAALAGGSSVPALAQGGATPIPVNQYQGMFTGEAVGLQLVDEGAQATPISNPIRIRRTGIASAQVVSWTENRFGVATIDHPDYSQGALYDDWIQNLVPSWTAQEPRYPVHGGMSTGGDVCPPVEDLMITPQDIVGRLMTDQPVGAGWYCLSLVLDRNAEGEPQSLIEGQGAEAAGAIFSYYVEGSEGIEGGFEDTNRIEYLRGQMNLPTGSGPGNVGISALDFGMGLISTTPNGSATRLQPQRNCFYFTLSREWVLTYGTGTMPGGAAADWATVYVMTWNGNDWSDPVVAFDHIDLFGSQQTDAEIDAIAVHHEQFDSALTAADAVRIVFSLTPESTIDRDGTIEMDLDQILVSQKTWNQNPPVVARPLATELGARVSSKIGLDTDPIEPDNVRGLCGRDPREQDGLDIYVGYPTEDMQDNDVFGDAYGPVNIGLSMFRYNDATPGRGDLMLQVSGVDGLLPTEIGVLFFDMEVVEVFQGGASRTVATDQILNVPVAFGSLTGQYSMPFSYIPPAPTAMGSRGYEFRVRARLHGLNILNLTEQRLNIGSSWTSSMRF